MYDVCTYVLRQQQQHPTQKSILAAKDRIEYPTVTHQGVAVITYIVNINYMNI